MPRRGIPIEGLGYHAPVTTNGLCMQNSQVNCSHPQRQTNKLSPQRQ